MECLKFFSFSQNFQVVNFVKIYPLLPDAELNSKEN